MTAFSTRCLLLQDQLPVLREHKPVYLPIVINQQLSPAGQQIAGPNDPRRAGLSAAIPRRQGLSSSVSGSFTAFPSAARAAQCCISETLYEYSNILEGVPIVVNRQNTIFSRLISN